jgi:hypothetical protein
MKLSESENRFVAKWQRQQRSWTWARWLIVVACGILIGLAACNLRRFLDFGDDLGGSTALAWLMPFAWLTLLAPSWLLGHALSQWRGDVKTRLLLRLIAEHENDDDKGQSKSPVG